MLAIVSLGMTYADTVIGFTPGVITSALNPGGTTAAPSVTYLPGDDKFLIDPTIAPTVGGFGYYTTTTGTVAGAAFSLNITYFAPPGQIGGSLLWVDRNGNASPPPTAILDAGDTIIAWVEGALVTPGDIIFGVSDLPA